MTYTDDDGDVYWWHLPFTDPEARRRCEACGHVETSCACTPEAE